LGRDDQGRQVLEFIPGQLSTDLPPLSTVELTRLGGLVRELHECMKTFRPPSGATWDVAVPPDRQELICHNDLGPWNLVRDGERWVFIDWDGAGPGSRLWDVAYAIQTFVPLEAGGALAVQQAGVRAIGDGYGLTDGQRRELPALIAARTWAMWELLQSDRQPWSRLNAAGHGALWRRSAEHVDRHVDDWRLALLR
jgi:Ser/Thr protein kinase RdoA (MazF antagonist)